MKVISYVSLLATSAGSASAATAFSQELCEHYCDLTQHQHGQPFGLLGFKGCKDNCAKSCSDVYDEGFDTSFCKRPCGWTDTDFGVACRANCDAKACPYIPPNHWIETTKCDAKLATKDRELATGNALLRNGAAELATAKSKETELVERVQRAEAMIINLKAQTEQLKTKETELATCTSSLIQIQREHRDAHQMRVRMTNERDTARSEAARAKRELVATTSELATAKECKAKSPNYKAPVNDECNPKNCDEWNCGQWCVCYNADHDATYEALGCASDDEDMCQCD